MGSRLRTTGLSAEREESQDNPPASSSYGDTHQIAKVLYSSARKISETR